LGAAIAGALLASLLAPAASPAASPDGWTFVQVQRVNSLQLQFGTDTYATQNAFGGAFAGVAQSSLQSSIDSSVADGSTSWLMEMPGLADLSGTSNTSFDTGIIDATPARPAGDPATYDGTSDLDWWYLPDNSELGPDGSPFNTVAGTFSAATFSAGPGHVKLSLIIGGSPAQMAISSTRIQAVAGSSSALTTSSNGYPPGHLAGEHLPSTLTSFGSMSSGKLAGHVSAGSLAAAPIPPSMAAGGPAACTEGYSSTNTLLDVLVTGCKVAGGLVLVTAVHPTQPDTVDPALGSGTYVFTTDVSKHVTGCTHNAGAASLSDCLAAAAYSAYFHFTTDRVIDENQVRIVNVLSVSTSGSGTVTSSPGGIDCGPDCSQAYGPSTQVTLTPTAAAGSSFTGWSGDCSGTGACTVLMDQARSVSATFAGPVQETPPGSGGSAPAGESPAVGTTDTAGATTTPPTAKCIVPKVTGKAFAKAKRAILNAHCTLGRIARSFSARVQKGRVIAQTPRSGKRLSAGSKIRLTLSKGHRRK